jgi:predicted CoA-binding protein
MMADIRATIEDFLSYRRLAMVGVSRSEKDFSRALFRELKTRGYDMVAVNPGVDEIDGQRCYARITDVSPAIEGVLLMTPGSVTEKVLEDCAAAGVQRVWMYRAIGGGAVTDVGLQFCEEHGIAVVPGECPFMFLAGAGMVHGLHRFCRKLMGTFPE